MYNYFKFKDDLERTAGYLEHQNKQQHWEARHQDDKQHSHEKYVSKVKDFVETAKQQPFYCEDDHFDNWRKLNLFRDAAQQKRFKGYKAFVYRDNRDMQSLADVRGRAENSLTEQHSDMLINKHLITPEMKLRSLQSQGPYESGVSFRNTRKKPLQPPLRFRSVTDQQKFIENHLPENKFNHVVFRTMDQKRSRIGVTTKSPIAGLNPTKGRTSDLERSISIGQDPGKTTKHVTKQRTRIISAIDPQSVNDQYSLYMRTPGKINSVIDTINKDHLRPLKKYHFKGVKELSLGATLNLKDCNTGVNAEQESVARTAKSVLVDSQVDREKHLENIRHNVNFEVYHKAPIL